MNIIQKTCCEFLIVELGSISEITLGFAGFWLELSGHRPYFDEADQDWPSRTS